MTTIGSLLQSPKAPQSASVVRNQSGNIEEKGAEFLELHTEAGIVYLCPSRLQRIRLRWAFRHFRVLPPEVLSRRDQRLIEKLSRSAVVTPTRPVANKTVFGVVEKTRTKSPVLAGAMVTQRADLGVTKAVGATPEVVDVKQIESTEGPGGQRTGDGRLRQQRTLAAAAAVCIAVLLASVYGVPLLSGMRQMRNHQTPSKAVNDAGDDRNRPNLPAAATGTLGLPSETASAPSAEKSKRRVAPWPPQPTPGRHTTVPVASGSGQSISTAGAGPPALPALTRGRHASHAASAGPSRIVASAAAKPPFVSELPQGHVVYPAVSGRNLVGELQLKALIGADGSVKKVTVLSGSPKLAEAGMRAVRHWHYKPYQVLGAPVEVETRIKISFFGPDAVSIASVANEPGTKLK